MTNELLTDNQTFLNPMLLFITLSILPLFFPLFIPLNSKFISNIKKHKAVFLKYKVVELCYTNIITFT